MKLSTVLAGCLVLVFSAVNTLAQECPDKLALVFDCLDKNNTAQWAAVKEYAKLIVQHLPGTADNSTPRVGLAAVDGEAGPNENLHMAFNGKDAQNKRELMASIGKIKTDRRQIKLSYTLIVMGEVVHVQDESKISVVIIKDGSEPSDITNADDDSVHQAMEVRHAKPMVYHFIRINDAAEDAIMKNLTTWFNGTDRAVVDHPKSSYTDLTPQAAFNFVKDSLHCVPFGKGGDTEESGNPSNSPLPLTKTSLPGVVGLWSSVLIVTTAASTF